MNVERRNNEMAQAVLIAQRGSSKITREELKDIPAPTPTLTHRPIPHDEVVGLLIETLSFRHIHAKHDEYAVSSNGMKLFGIMTLETEYSGVNFAIGLRNSNDKSMRLALTAGYRVLVCSNMAFHGEFLPIQHKHTHGLELSEAVSVGVDKIQRNFASLEHQIAAWQRRGLYDSQAKLIIYQAFIQSDFPKQLMNTVHDYYFNPRYEEFSGRNLWSLSNAFTSAFKDLSPVAQFRMTARLAGFMPQFG